MLYDMQLIWVKFSYVIKKKKKKKNAETFVIAPLRNPEEVEIIKCKKPSDLKKVNPSLW